MAKCLLQKKSPLAETLVNTRNFEASSFLINVESMKHPVLRISLRIFQNKNVRRDLKISTNEYDIFYTSIENLGFQMRRMYYFAKKFDPCMLTLVAISIPKSWFLSWTAVTITPTERSAPVAAVYSIRASYCTCRSSFDCIFSLVWHGSRFGYYCLDSIFFFEIFIPMSNDSK